MLLTHLICIISNSNYESAGGVPVKLTSKQNQVRLLACTSFTSNLPISKDSELVESTIYLLLLSGGDSLNLFSCVGATYLLVSAHHADPTSPLHTGWLKVRKPVQRHHLNNIKDKKNHQKIILQSWPIPRPQALPPANLTMRTSSLNVQISKDFRSASRNFLTQISTFQMLKSTNHSRTPIKLQRHCIDAESGRLYLSWRGTQYRQYELHGIVRNLKRTSVDIWTSNFTKIDWSLLLLLEHELSNNYSMKIKKIFLISESARFRTKGVKMRPSSWAVNFKDNLKSIPSVYGHLHTSQFYSTFVPAISVWTWNADARAPKPDLADKTPL